jgi:hypothetical protein
MKNTLIRQILRFSFWLMSYLIQFENLIVRKTIRWRWKKIPRPLHKPLPYEGQKDSLDASFLLIKEARWVETSGTRSEPKRIPYGVERIEYLNRTFLKSMITLTSHLKGPKTFFVFGSLDEDKSLTSSLISEKKEPQYYELLQAPYRYLNTAEGKKLRDVVGDLTARVLVLIVSKPRIIYATNPSTISHFIEQIEKNWDEVRKQLKIALKNKALMDALYTLEDGNGKDRLTYAAILEKVDLKAIFPELIAMITWNGGYVSSFIDQLKVKLPKVEHIPMYSMSTECVETLPHRIQGKIVFLPTMKGVLPEFQDTNGEIQDGLDLEVGKVYSLIVTDIWGLQRYDTHDEFVVNKMVDGLPDLSFKRRRNITSSLTGEKLTEEQAILLYAKLKADFTGLTNASLSLFPVIEGDSHGYHLSIIGGAGEAKEISVAAEKILSSLNSEYASKVKSGRLHSLQARHMNTVDLARIMKQEHLWESQFKVMPLYEKPVRKDS